MKKLKTIILLSLLMIVSTGCSVKKYKVLDSSTSLPIPGVKVYAVAQGRFPGIGETTKVTLHRWYLESDQNGEFSISWPSIDQLSVETLDKEGFGTISYSITEYLYRKSAKEDANSMVYFMTPQADLAAEQIKFLFYTLMEKKSSKEKDIYGRGPILVTVISYEVAKIYSKTLPHVYKTQNNTAKVREALHDYCHFIPEMKDQAVTGWPDIPQIIEPGVSRDRMIRSGQELVNDCEARQ
jgi:hypothetical protein